MYNNPLFNRTFKGYSKKKNVLKGPKITFRAVLSAKCPKIIYLFLLIHSLPEQVFIINIPVGEMYPPLSPWTVDRGWVFHHRGNPREIREVGFWGLLAVSRDKPRIEFSASGLPTKVLNSRFYFQIFKL